MGSHGAPTKPDDHSGHGAYSWRDYFRVNTDHKVIGIQYIVTSFFFMFVGGLLAMLMRAELAQPGLQFVDTSTFNGLFSVHASLMIWVPGWASSARISIARKPPMKKKMNEVTVYWIPITL